MAHKHSVYDNDKHFSIDPVTREITNESGKFVLIQHDHNSERFTFEIPKEVDGHDMSLCNVVQIHYLNVELDKANAAALENAEAEGAGVETVVLDDVIYIPTGTVYPGIYESDDVQISPASEDVVICSWLISRNATQYLGTLNFIVRFACVAVDGTEEYAWSTAPYEGIVISDGIYNSDIIIADYTDMLEKWRAETVAIVREEISDAIEGVSFFDFVATIPTSGWKGTTEPFYVDVPIIGWREKYSPIPGVNYSALTSSADILDARNAAANIFRFASYEGGIRVYSTEIPDKEIPILLKAVIG